MIIPAHLEEVDAAWLIDVLQLKSGMVLSVIQTSNAAFNSTIAHLHVTYAETASDKLPARLVVKLNSQGWGEGETVFYREVMQLKSRLPMLLPCYAAEYDSSTGKSVLLLEDISATHRNPVSRDQVLAGSGVPVDEHLNQLVDALGRFHAYWWEQQQRELALMAVRPWYDTRTNYERHVARRQGEWATFKAQVGDEVPENIHRLYEGVLAKLPLLWESYLAPRVLTGKQMTLSHGDCYFSQFLCPHDPAIDRTYMIDFQDVSGNFPTYDLAYLLPTFWSREQRLENDRELRLLRRYHNVLLENGVRNYSWGQLQEDYRLSLTLMIFDAVFNQASGSDKAYWWLKMRCLIEAFQDWQSAEWLEKLVN